MNSSETFSFIQTFVNLDAKSMAGALIWANAAAVIVIAAYRLSSCNAGGYATLKLITLGKLFQMATWILVVSRPRLSPILTSNLANSLFIIAMYWEAKSCCSITGCGSRNSRALEMLLALALLQYNLGEFILPDPSWRVVFACLGVFLVICIPSARLAFTRGLSRFKRVVGFFYFSFTVFLVLRSYTALANHAVIFTPAALNQISFIAMLMLNAVSGAFLFLVLAEQLETSSRLRAEELTRAAAAAREASSVKSNFLANMSHEIRTPMNGILGLSELAMADASVSPKIRDKLDKINLGTQSLLGVINGILDITKVESGKIEIEQIPFSLSEVLSLCRAAIMPKARGKGIELTCQVDPLQGRELLGDPTRLRQVLLNLLLNAVQYTERGGVMLAVSLLEERDDTAMLLFEIVDSGRGMTEAELEQACQPFVQADSPRRYGGTGLGLPISKSIIELMGGRLEARTSPGRGSAFFFRLRFPVRKARSSKGTNPAHHIRTNPVPRFAGDVLVCEDNELNQEVMSEHLSLVGLQPFIAANGRIGVEMAEQRRRQGKPFDLIFMDINMPVMNGREAARALRNLGNPSPIIAVTANVMSSDREEYAECGISDCLPKPFDGKNLWSCLRRHLTERPDQAGTAAPQPEAEPEAAGGTPDGEAGGQVIDFALGLEQAAGNRELYLRILSKFTVKNAGCAREIREAAADSEQARHLAHTLKGVARLIGATALAESAYRLENAFAGRAGPATESDFAALDAELAKTVAAIKDMRIDAAHS